MPITGKKSLLTDQANLNPLDLPRLGFRGGAWERFFSLPGTKLMYTPGQHTRNGQIFPRQDRRNHDDRLQLQRVGPFERNYCGQRKGRSEDGF